MEKKLMEKLMGKLTETCPELTDQCEISSCYPTQPFPESPHFHLMVGYELTKVITGKGGTQAAVN
jgi:hypothetical protein